LAFTIIKEELGELPTGADALKNEGEQQEKKDTKPAATPSLANKILSGRTWRRFFLTCSLSAYSSWRWWGELYNQMEHTQRSRHSQRKWWRMWALLSAI
jgi:hypothetical protein